MNTNSKLNLLRIVRQMRPLFMRYTETMIMYSSATQWTLGDNIAAIY